jgi:hypothetical protein
MIRYNFQKQFVTGRSSSMSSVPLVIERGFKEKFFDYPNIEIN